MRVNDDRSKEAVTNQTHTAGKFANLELRRQAMEYIKYRVCYGNFEIRRSELPRNIDDYQLKFYASDKAIEDDYSVFAEFDAKDQAFSELNKHKSDIRETQLRVGNGYCGTVWWLESADDNSVERLADAKWE